MTHKSHFSSPRSALVLGLAAVASLTFAGVSFAQSLNIPTNLDNAVITIKKVFLSSNGVKTDTNGASIVLDGTDGYMYLKNNDFMSQCNNNTGCVLKVGTNGKVTLTTNVSPWINDEQNSVFRRVSGASTENSYFSTPSGTAARIGQNSSVLRVGVGNTDGNDNINTPLDPRTAMVVGGKIESRGDILIKKINSIESNEGENVNKTNLNKNYTSLKMIADNNQISFESEGVSNLGAYQPTIFLFKNPNNINGTKVGINMISTPQATLDVNGSNMVRNWISVGNNLPWDNTISLLVNKGKFIQRAYTVNSAGEKIYNIFSDADSRKVGINVTSDPTANLQVGGGSTAADASTFLVGSTTTPTLYAKTDTTNAANNNVGIGTVNPTDKLQVVGTVRANSYVYNSDRRYKSDIEVLKSPLENLLKLSGYSYYNKLSGKKDLGVIAQEVETVYPDLVQTDADGYKSVEYGNLVAPIIEAIKELSNKVDTLFTTYLSQQAKIDSLEARLQLLESKMK